MSTNKKAAYYGMLLFYCLQKMSEEALALCNSAGYAGKLQIIVQLLVVLYN